MFNFKRLLCTTAMMIITLVSFSQQLPLYSQYVYNKFLINPAHAGSDGYTSFNITAREQWVGISGSPETYSLSWQTRLLKRGYNIKTNFLNRQVYLPKSEGKVGLGGYLFTDKSGLTQRTGFQAAYSYNLRIRNNTQLSLGIAFAGYHFKINANESSFGDPGEPWIRDDLRKGIFIPDVDAGIYLLNPAFDFGFSALQLIGASAKTGSSFYKSYSMSRHYYLFGSYNIDSGSDSEIEPSFLLKISDQIKPQADITVNYVHNQAMWIGLSYRTGSSLIASMRFRYIPGHTKWTSLFFGYSFDFSFNQLQSITYGSHELTIAIKFGDSSRKYRWLDRY
jgi:type IX secretion system PorP/SprF family membrane protein